MPSAKQKENFIYTLLGAQTKKFERQKKKKSKPFGSNVAPTFKWFSH